MKLRTILVCFLLLVSTVLQSTPSNASVLTGKTCTQLNLKKISAEKLYTCVKKGSKRVWNSGSDLIPTEVVSFDATSSSSLIPFSFLATKGDSCIASLAYGLIGTSVKTFIPVQNLRTVSSFEITPTAGVIRLSVQCKYSGNASESIRIATPTPSPAPTPSLAIKPSPTPTPTPSPTFSISPVTNFSGTDNSSTIDFSFSPAQGNVSASNYEVGIAYLKTATSDQTLLSSYSDIEIYLNLGIRTIFAITPNQVREYLLGKSITSSDRTVMFFVRGTYGDTKGTWSRGIYLTPAQINRGTQSVPSPTPTPTRTPTPTPTPTQSNEVFGLNVLGTWAGPDPLDASLGWWWVVTKVQNKATSGVLASTLYTSTYTNSGVSVDSNTESGPTLKGGEIGWMASTIHSSSSASNTYLSPLTTPRRSQISLSELPTISNPTLVSVSGGSAVRVTLRNNSNSKFLYKSTDTNVVFLNSSGIPVYAFWGSLPASIAPGATVTVDLLAHLGSPLKSPPSGYTSIEISLGVVLTDADSSYSNFTW